MFADDQEYLSGMASAALAVLMVLVMLWIRSQIPDDLSADALPAQSAAAADATIDANALSPTRDAIASVYECVSRDSRTSSDSPCSAGAVLRHIGVPSQHHKTGDASVVHHR